MPRYVKGRGKKKLVKKKKRFKHPYEVLHALSSTQPDHFQHYRDLAQDYYSGSKVPPIPLNRSSLADMVDQNQQYLTSQAAHDFQDGLGGGIASAASVIGSELSHLVGADKFLDWVGHLKKPKKYQTLDSQVAAFLTDMTYKNLGDRPELALMYKRLDKYDTAHCSVWQNRDTDELMLCVRGTKLKAKDLQQDLSVLLGGIRVEDAEFKQVLNQLKTDYPHEKYNVAGHSLGAVYIMQEAGQWSDQWNKTYLFNAPSSPAQDDSVISDRVNNYGLDFYQNHGDMLGQNTNHFFNNETLDEHVYWGTYKWDPVSSHYLSSWYPAQFNNNAPSSTRIDNQPSSMDTAEFQQDNETSQAENLS
jgi:hypothetical protein